MRFRILNVLTKSSGITDNGELMTFDEVVDKLNCFDKEVKELKGQVIKLELLNNVTDENMKLKQFKFNTLKLIDKNIKKYQNHLEDVEDDAVCPERYIWEIKGHLQALTELKEALNE